MGDLVIGATLGFHLDTFLLSRNDDDAEVSHGEIIEVVRLMLVLLFDVVPALDAVDIFELTTFLSNIINIFFVRDVHGVEGTIKWSMFL